MATYPEQVNYVLDGDGAVVRFVFRTDEDSRRQTAFYQTINEYAAKALVDALGAAGVKVRFPNREVVGDMVSPTAEDIEDSQNGAATQRTS